MQLIFQLLFLFALVSACQTSGEPSKEEPKAKTEQHFAAQKRHTAAQNFDISTFQTANGWAYQIRQNGKLVIDQPTIPGRPGIAGFQTQADAQKVAELVTAKLKAKEFPPSVSEADLQNLNIH